MDQSPGETSSVRSFVDRDPVKPVAIPPRRGAAPAARGPGLFQVILASQNSHKVLLTLKVRNGIISTSFREWNCLRQPGGSAEGSERHTAMKRMRILLQQKDTGLYLRTAGMWVPHAAEAMDFVSSTAAIDYCTANKLNGVQLVLKFTEEKHDIVMPVIAIQPAPARTHRASHVR